MMRTELEALFDFQRFWKNTHLESLAEETLERYCPGLSERRESCGEAWGEGMPAGELSGHELSDNELSFVSAAGEPDVMEAAINLLRKEDGGDG